MRVNHKHLTAAVKRLYELGLTENEIVKLFASFDISIIFETLKKFKGLESKVGLSWFINTMQQISYVENINRSNIIIEPIRNIMDRQL